MPNTIATSGDPQSGGGAIPQAPDQSQLASAGLQIQDLLTKRSQVDAAISTTLPQALAPVQQQGRTSAKMPGSLNFSVGQPKFAAPQGSRDAKAQGISKTVAGVAGLVGSILKAKKEMKQRDLAHDITRVMGAQDSISEASQVLAGDPNNKDAKAVIDKNKQIINDTIGADPKKLKEFEKAFDINFMDPSKNTNDEHGALKIASKSYADQLAAKAPPKLAPNTAAISKVQALQEQGKTLDAQIKALVPIANEQMKESNANARTAAQVQGRADVANTHEAQANQRAVLRAEINAAQMAVSKQIAQLKSNTAYGIESRREAAALERTNKLIDGRTTAAERLRGKNPVAAGKLDEQVAALYEKQVEKLPDLIAKTIQARDQDVKSGAHKDQVEQWDTQINTYKSQLSLYQRALGQYAKDNMNIPPEEKKGGTTNAGVNDGSKPTQSSQAQVIGGESDDSEDDPDKFDE